MPKHERVELGDECRDTVTGYVGIAVAKTDWLNGCTRVVLQGKLKKGEDKIPEGQSFDEPQLEIITKQKVSGPDLVKRAVETTGKTGGPDRYKIKRL